MANAVIEGNQGKEVAGAETINVEEGSSRVI